MITITHKWGADYLVFDEPIHPEPVTLTSPQGLSLVPGQQVQQIGHRHRSCFELLPGISMTYEGLLKLNQLTYAIFHCPQHDIEQLRLFDHMQYRYAFTCVFVQGRFDCFLIGRAGPHGLADIQLDFIR